MRWIHPLSPELDASTDVVGAKAHGLTELQRLGLPVPPGFVVTTEACRAYLRGGRLPHRLREELIAAIADLESRTGRHFGGTPVLAVSVRSGASVSMPGMMTTILNLGLTTRTPDDAIEHLLLAIEAVFGSWNTPRAQAYRELHDIDHELGTAVVVQAMVFGNRDDHSGTGVAFSRDPTTGDNVPFGDVLFAHQGDAVVGGTVRTLPLRTLKAREPAVWGALIDALGRIEAHYRDAVHVEFTYEAGELWLLQTRPGRFTGAAAVRLAVDLAEARVITRAEAVLRVSPHHLEQARVPRIAQSEQVDVIAHGVGASPGVAVGAIATTTRAAIRMAAGGEVILARPETSPNDLSGLAAATGIITARGGVASHAAVVARSMGKPAVVGIDDLVIDDRQGTITVGGRDLQDGTVVTIDGTSGQVALGRSPIDTGAENRYVDRLLTWVDELT
jgi:pyruvate,orthophosphate dikinase